MATMIQQQVEGVIFKMKNPHTCNEVRDTPIGRVYTLINNDEGLEKSDEEIAEKVSLIFQALEGEGVFEY